MICCPTIELRKSVTVRPDSPGHFVDADILDHRLSTAYTHVTLEKTTKTLKKPHACTPIVARNTVLTPPSSPEVFLHRSFINLLISNNRLTRMIFSAKLLKSTRPINKPSSKTKPTPISPSNMHSK